MKSPWDIDDKAFAPMYEDRISVEGRHGTRHIKSGELAACIFDQGFEDPICDDSTASTRRLYTVNIRIKDWPETEAPRHGDTIILEDGTHLSIKSVARTMGDFQMEVRT